MYRGSGKGGESKGGPSPRSRKRSGRGKERVMIWDTAAHRADVQTAQTPKSTYLRYRERKYGHRLRINRKRSQSIALLLEEHALQVGQERTIISGNIGQQTIHFLSREQNRLTLHRDQQRTQARPKPETYVLAAFEQYDAAYCS